MKLVKIKAIFQIVIFLMSIFTITLIKEAKIVEAANVCCENTKKDSPYLGESCVFTDESNCDIGGKAGTACENTNYCKPGCCYNRNTGQCSKNTLKASCEAEGGTFDSNVNCEISQCATGCCKLPTECALTTQTECAAAISGYPYLQLQNSFDSSIKNEADCTKQCRSAEVGCCVRSNGCSFGSNSECTDGEFRAGYLCSNPQLNCQCTKEHRTGCISGKDEVYWFDSCGNPENIYGTSYTGFARTKEESCNPSDANIESINCGNCDYSKGSICSTASADYLSKVNNDKVRHMCSDLNCKTTTNINRYGVDVLSWDGGAKKSGESWCEYEGVTGQGKDLVGSTQYVRACVNGKELVLDCQADRKEICVQTTVEKELTELDYDLLGAECKVNNYGSCLQCNTEQSCGQECENLNHYSGKCEAIDKSDQRKECNKRECCRKKCCTNTFGDCYWHEGLGYCAPSVPPSGSQSCFGSTTCTEIWVKKHFADDWDCEVNCGCAQKTDDFNSFCRSLGDCGASYNVVGKFSKDGFSASKNGDKGSQPRPVTQESWSNFNKASQALKNPLFSLLYNAIFVLANTPLERIDKSWIESKNAALNTIAVSLGTTSLIALLGFTGTLSATLGGGAPILGASIGFTTGFTNLLSLTGIGNFNFVGGFFGIAATVFAALAILAFLWFLLSLGADQKDIVYTFNCNAWVAPTGGQDCEKCDDFTKCDKYKCESLGQGCTFFEDERTGNGTCIWKDKNDATVPIISALPIPPRTLSDLTTSNNGYEFKSNIKAFTPVDIGVKTNEKAQCRISTRNEFSFDEGELFGDTVPEQEHQIHIPILYENATFSEIGISKSGSYTYFVKCQDVNGNKNRASYFIKFNVASGPDLTSPVIEQYSIQDNAKIPYDKKETELVLYLNEPGKLIGGCKYSKQDKNYNLMEGNFTCSSFRGSLNLYPCVGTLSNIEDNKENTYYFRCQDLAGNINQESQPLGGFNLIGTIPLNITSIEPSGALYTRNITLSVRTTGGANGDGSANCTYSLLNNYDYSGLGFASSSGNLHTSVLDLGTGTYNLYVTCKDIAGNIATGSTNVDLQVDLTGPNVARIYTEQNFLYIITSEDSTCEYSNRPFSYGTGNRMPEDQTKEHRATLGQDVYYIKCRDLYDNEVGLTVYP